MKLSSSLVVLTVCRLVQAIPARVLIYSATAGFRHDSIPTAIAALKSEAETINVQFDATEDKTRFTDTSLGVYDAVMFLSTTGEVLDDSGKAAFLAYLKKGGNFVGVHSASDTLVNTTFYGRELGAYFDYHPQLQNATVDVIDPSHPSTTKLPKAWKVQDEIYNFKSDPRSIGATVVLAADESSYVDDGTRRFNQGFPHPIAWYQNAGAGVSGEEGTIAGRSFYTSLGHLNETWQDDTFMTHVLGGLSWVLQSNTTRVTNSSALVGNLDGSSAPSATGASATGSGGVFPSTSSARSSRILDFPSAKVCTMTVLGLTLGYVSLAWLSGRDNGD